MRRFAHCIIFRDLKLKMDESTRNAVLSFLKRDLQPSDNSPLNSHVLRFLEDDSSNECSMKSVYEQISPTRPISPPIFERSRRPHHPLKEIDHGFESMKDIQQKVPLVDVEMDNDDFAQENMAVVDGWSELLVSIEC